MALDQKILKLFDERTTSASDTGNLKSESDLGDSGSEDCIFRVVMKLDTEVRKPNQKFTRGKSHTVIPKLRFNDG